MSTTSQDTIWKRSVCMSVELRKPGINRKGDMQLVQTQGAEKESLRLQKVLFECEEYNSICALDSKIREVMRAANAGSSHVLRGGLYLIPHGLVERTDQQLRELFVRRDELIEAFLAAYPQAVEQAREALAEQFDEDDYPSVSNIRKHFSHSTGYVNFGVPGELANISNVIFAEAMQNEEKRLREATDEVRETLRLVARETLDSLVDRLTPTDDGKRKILRQSAIEKVSSFLDTFNARNITDDGELSELVEKARDVLGHASDDGLRSDDTVRRDVRERVGEIVDAIKALPLRQERMIELLS